ncbi:MAG: hypothetical protein WCG78_01545 [Candidatus Omnitrophota bacterium]
MKKKGSALIMVMIVMIIVSIGITTLLQAMLSYLSMRKSNLDRVTGLYLTDAGVTYGLWQVEQGNYTSPVTFTEQGRTITVTEIKQADGTYAISGTVQYPGF